LAIVAAVGLFLAYFAWTAIVGPVGISLTSPTPDAGQAAGQFGAVGFYLHVTRVERTPANEVLIWMTFPNTSDRQQRVDNEDFELQAHTGNRVHWTAGDGCSNGIRVDLYSETMARTTPLRDPGGERAGSIYKTDVCFPNPGSTPWALIWQPDVAFGPLSEPIRVPLR
jgi:hypothetical protein